MTTETEPRRGKEVVLLPYVRGVGARDTLLRWWLLMEQGQGSPRIFHAQSVLHETQRGDPIAFVEAFAHRFAFGVYAADSEELIGFNWLENIKPGRTAHFGLFYTRKAWGAKAAEATTLATTYGFGTLGLKIIWGVTPWRLAMRHVLKLGWSHEATLRDFSWVNDQPRDIYIMRTDVLQE